MTIHSWLSLTLIDLMITSKEKAAMELVVITAMMLAIAAILDTDVVVAVEATDVLGTTRPARQPGGGRTWAR